MNCPVCEMSKKQKIYKKVNEYSSFICANCDHIYVNDEKLNSIDYSALYGEEFYENYMSGLGYRKAYNDILKGDFQKKISLLKKILPEGAEILEVGSGPGFFASLLKNEGYRVTPVELTPGAQKYADKSSLQIEIINEDLSDEECSIYNQKFDCVISWAVIEHVYNAGEFVRLLKRYTKKNGFICIDTGITTKILSIIDTGYTSWLFPPLHLHVFSRKSMKHIVEKNGLEVYLFKPFFNYSSSVGKLFLMYIKKFITALVNMAMVIDKNQEGKTAFIGLIVLRNV